MKLLTRYNRTNIAIAFMVLVVSSITYYFIIRYILLDQVDRDLKVEEQEIKAYVINFNSLPLTINNRRHKTLFSRINSGNIKRQLADGTVPDEHDHEDLEPVRVLTFPLTVNNTFYKATVIKSEVETEDLLELIVKVTAGIFILLIVITSLVNRFLLQKLWQPFYNTLDLLKTYDVKDLKPIEFPATKLEEFDELNNSVSAMTKRVNNEFETLKAFTDNASHEMQTPLAIINSKLDLLLQTSTETQGEPLQTIYNATGRLTKLNQTLLLFTKINAQQFNKTEVVDLKTVLQQKLNQFDELRQVKSIELTATLNDCLVSMNRDLLEVLLNNLLSNAIRHNHQNGYIICTLTAQQLVLANSGPPLTFSPANIFNRFQKSTHSTGTGLGLAVVKEICDSTGFTITYNGQNGHTFTICF